MTVKHIPEGYRTVTPYLIVADVKGEIEFMKRAFGAALTFAHERPDGSFGHCELRIGDSLVMMGQAAPEKATLHLYVDDCDATYRAALAAGARSLQEPKVQFYGDRAAGVVDRNGVSWWIATHVEDVAEDEMKRRAAAQGR